MKRLSAISPLLGAAALVACAACTSTPPARLEAIRAAGQRLRERHPGRPVGGQGTLAEAKAFAATGESEEIDFWRLTSDPTPAELAELRAAFDGAGGRAVQILRPGEEFRAVRPAQMLAAAGDRAGDVLVAGTDRVLRVGPGGHVDWEKRGCGNVHCAYVHGNFVYYSNGAVYRVPRKGGTPWNNPERVWAPENVAGGGVLCFDMTPEGSLVMAVNSTCEVVELDLRSRIELARFAVDARNAEGKLPPPHGRIRCAHKTASGTYLVACAGAETVREFDRAGQVVWSVKAPAFVFDAVRRPNGIARDGPHGVQARRHGLLDAEAGGRPRPARRELHRAPAASERQPRGRHVGERRGRRLARGRVRGDVRKEGCLVARLVDGRQHDERAAPRLTREFEPQRTQRSQSAFKGER